MYYPTTTYAKPIAIKSLFCESGTYQPMALRTYTTNYTEDLSGKILNETENGMKLGKNSLAHLATEILTPSTAPTANLTIDEGWGTKRFTFVMEIKSPNTGAMGSTSSVVLTGYTNYTDLSFVTKSFDPNMRLYFNSSSIIDDLTTRLPTGQVSTRRVLKDASHLLTSAVINNIVPTFAPTYNFQDPHQPTGTAWLLPKNVIEEMQTQQFHKANSFGGTTVMDYRRMANSDDVIRSRRENAVTGSYLNTILSNVVEEFGNNTGYEGSDITALSQASYSAKELSIYNDNVFNLILTRTNYLRQGYVTWAELCSVVDALDERTAYTLRESQVMNTGVPETYAGNAEHWAGTTYETLIANNISQLVPAIMTSSLIGNISFMFSNDNLTLNPEVTVLNGNALIEGIALSTLVTQFIHRFNNEVVPLITNQNRTIVSVMVHSNIGTETHISVSYNNGPTIPFCAPTFCDAMYTPIVTPNVSAITDIASDLYSIAGTITNNKFIY